MAGRDHRRAFDSVMSPAVQSGLWVKHLVNLSQDFVIGAIMRDDAYLFPREKSRVSRESVSNDNRRNRRE